MRIIKKTIGLMLIALVATVTLMPSKADASNHSDTTFSFTTGTSGTQGFISQGRRKDNATSVYIKCTGATTINSPNATGQNFRAIAYGAYDLNGTYTRNIWNNRVSHEYTVRAGSEIFMINYINEAGRRFARIHYNPVSGNTTFSGVWSPDSI